MSLKPQILVQDVEGQQRALDSVSDRLIKGGTWKKQRTIVIIPAADMIPAQVALSWWNIVFPPNQGCVRLIAQGMEVGDAYSSAIDMILSHPELRTWEYVMTIEHDNTVPPDAALALIEQMELHPEMSAISALYFCKGHGGSAQIWGDISDPNINFRPQVPRPNTLQECYGIGMGCALWRLSMLKDERIPRPLFKTYKESNGAATQDLAFAMNARKFGYRFGVYTGVRSGHVDVDGSFGEGKGYVW